MDQPQKIFLYFMKQDKQYEDKLTLRHRENKFYWIVAVLSLTGEEESFWHIYRDAILHFFFIWADVARGLEFSSLYLPLARQLTFLSSFFRDICTHRSTSKYKHMVFNSSITYVFM